MGNADAVPDVTTPKAVPDVTTPKEDTDSDVFVMMTTMPQGILCHAHGTVIFPTTSYMSVGVYLQVVEDKITSLPTAQAVVDAVNGGTLGNHGKKIPFNGATLGTAYQWTCDNSLGVWCSPTTKTKYNTLLAVTASANFNTSTGKLDSVLEGPNAIHFYGKATTTPCAPDAAVARSESVLTVNGDEPMVHPTDIDGDWLLYGGIDVATLGMGPVLMLDGKPLSARVLAVAAKRVCWWHGDDLSQLVSRAAGELRTNDVSGGARRFYSYPDISHSGIVLNQFTSSAFWVGALSSECREHPDRFSFDPSYAIRAQVNYRRGEPRTGSYDLWVKVITR